MNRSTRGGEIITSPDAGMIFIEIFSSIVYAALNKTKYALLHRSLKEKRMLLNAKQA